MPLSSAVIQGLAEHLESAEREVRDLDKISNLHPDMTMDDAYDIQDAIRARKLSRGARLVGYKVGLTSRAKMRQMGVSEPSYGFLLDHFVVSEGADVDCSQLIHPRVEPEIAFVMRSALRGPGCHIAAVLAATDFVVPAIEILDSRYRDFKFDLVSVVADNASSSRFVLGGQVTRIDGLDLRTLGMVMERGGEVIGIAASAAILGHPALSVAMLANMLARRGEEVPAGAIILTGGATEAIAVGRGDAVTLRVGGLGSVSVRFQ